MDRDTLINLHPKSSTEKLLWERTMNKLLSKELRKAKEEIGSLKSYIEELEDTDAKNMMICKMSERICNLRKEIDNLRAQNKRLKNGTM